MVEEGSQEGGEESPLEEKESEDVRDEHGDNDESYIYPLPHKPNSKSDVDVTISSTTPAFQCLDEV